MVAIIIGPSQERSQRQEHSSATNPNEQERQKNAHLHFERQRPEDIHDRFDVREVLDQQQVGKDRHLSGQYTHGESGDAVNIGIEP